MPVPNTSFYGSSAATPSNSAAAAAAADTWDWSNSAATAAPVAASANTNNDWYSGGSNDESSSTNNNSNNMYATSGYAAHPSAAAAPAATNAFYPSTAASAAASATTRTDQQQHHQQNQQQPYFSGSMDSSTHSATAPTMMQPQQFIPQPGGTTVMAGSGFTDSSSTDPSPDEPPLLEELGVNLSHIGVKTKAVILPFSRSSGDTTIMDPAIICRDADLAGPIAFYLLLGGEMVLSGKLQFGYVYGFAVFGCVCMTLILNLTSPSDSISVWTVASVLGYALIPVNLLAAVKLLLVNNLVNLQTLGRLLGLLTVAWSTVASTRLLELGCGLREQRYLIAYPIALLYSAFVLITIF
jgi:hypothetical protein